MPWKIKQFLCLVGIHIPTIDGLRCQICRKSLLPEGPVRIVGESDPRIDAERTISEIRRGK